MGEDGVGKMLVIPAKAGLSTAELVIQFFFSFLKQKLSLVLRTSELVLA